MPILLLDNYDSFTYNLLHLIEKVSEARVVVRKNDEISVEEAAAFDAIVLSPGPGLPSEAGVMPELLRRYSGNKPFLGVCLGLQAITENFGGSLLNLGEVSHGQARETIVTGDDLLFRGCPRNFISARYHSWVANEANLPGDLVVTARDASGHIMALAHRSLDVRGVQFHPESVLAEHGERIMSNWLNRDR